jgi:hypothetical protein
MVKGPRLIFAELKAEGEQPTPEQREWLRDLAGAGEVEVYVWRPSDWPAIEATLTGRHE